MLRYVITQEQLDHIQDQIQLLSKLNEAKQNRIKTLEHHKIFAFKCETADLLKANEVLKKQNSELESIIEKLKAELEFEKSNAKKIKELELLLEEQKVKKYSEALARQMEIKCAEESLIKDLTFELFELQKAEMNMTKGRLQELQNMLNSTDEAGFVRLPGRNRPKYNRSRENTVRNEKLKFIVEQLKAQLLNFVSEFVHNSALVKENQKPIKELEKWLREVELMTAEVNEIENLRENLKNMKNEIETRRKSVNKKNSTEPNEGEVFY